MTKQKPAHYLQAEQIKSKKKNGLIKKFSKSRGNNFSESRSINMKLKFDQQILPIAST